jgi:hypothetical protein
MASVTLPLCNSMKTNRLGEAKKKNPKKRGQLAVNRDKPDRWKADITQSVDLFNEWFMVFAPKAFRETRVAKTGSVEAALGWTDNMFNSVMP